MRILSAGAIALLLLAGCSTTSEPPPSHPTWCNKDPKKEPHSHDCNGNLILPGHMPEECIPEKAAEPVVQKPIEPPKPDPIVGTYEVYYSRLDNIKSIHRFYADGTATLQNDGDMRWELRDGEYDVFQKISDSWSLRYSLSLQFIKREPNLVSHPKRQPSFFRFEALKLSDDPDHQFDFYAFRIEWKSGAHEWNCYNVGRGEKAGLHSMTSPVGNSAETLEACVALCPQAKRNMYMDPRLGPGDSNEDRERRIRSVTCPQERT